MNGLYIPYSRTSLFIQKICSPKQQEKCSRIEYIWCQNELPSYFLTWHTHNFICVISKYETNLYMLQLHMEDERIP